jgi:hypothetical protein
VQIHHSRDLVHWKLITRPLTRPSQLNMLGDPDSCGVWAPCLTHADGRFWLIYTDVKRYGRTTVGGASGASLRDFHNYLVTADDIEGPWSDPVYLNSSGFDPSLFHDDDGRKWLLNQLWDHRPGRNRDHETEAGNGENGKEVAAAAPLCPAVYGIEHRKLGFLRLRPSRGPGAKAVPDSQLGIECAAAKSTHFQPLEVP